MTKPINPNLNIPAAFAVNGTKTDFTNEKLQSGFDDTNPDILAGDNLNKLIDDTYKGLNFTIDGVEDLYDVTDTNANAIAAHVANTSNPHNVTKAQVGLSNVNNTSDANKPISTATQAALDNKTNIALDNLSTAGDNRLHALKGYSDNGELLTDAEGLADVQTYAHSTFDLSKFTVVGSPTITDDGIASDFEDSNRIYTEFDYNGGIFEVTVGYYWQTDSNGGNIVFVRSNQASNFEVLRLYQNNLDSVTIYAISGENLSFTTTEYSPETNDFIIAKLKINSNKTVTGTIINVTKNITITKTTTGTITKELTSADNKLYLGNSNGYERYTGNIDLKYTEIVIDGIPVFSGNKTGIDTIKPDDYTVVGSPTISTDGILSNISQTNYVKKVLTNQSWNNFEITFDNIHCNTTNAIQVFFDMYGASSQRIHVRKNANGQIQLYISINNTVKLFNEASTISGKIGFDGTKYYWTINGVSDTLTSSTLLTQEDYTIYFGCFYDLTGGGLTNGSIDLNAFKIYVNGNLVYQPCLKIPYTESKTGSKVVDRQYRDRVTDMYKQYGYAPYYTLSDTDFTLPMGEIYGMIEKRARDIAHPVAQPFCRFSDEINEDEVRLEGAEVDKGLYLAIEQDPYLSALCTAGSTADKICLPDFRNRVIYGDVASGYVEPELPNITGSLGTDTAVDGAFYNPGGQRPGPSGGTEGTDANVYFDASRSSSIYKNGGTVKTAGVKARWLCRWK